MIGQNTLVIGKTITFWANWYCICPKEMHIQNPLFNFEQQSLQRGKGSMASHVTVPALTAEWNGKAGVEWRKAWQATCRLDRIVFKCGSQFINSRLRDKHWLALNPIAAEWHTKTVNDFEYVAIGMVTHVPLLLLLSSKTAEEISHSFLQGRLCERSCRMCLLDETTK